MRRWLPALLAAAAVEASSGMMAAALANAAGGGHSVPLVFTLSALGAALADVVLVPGWVWNPLPPVPSRLAGRALAALLTLGAALIAGTCAMLPVLFVGLKYLNGGGGPSMLDSALFGLPFMIGGGVAGYGAWATERWSGVPGTAQARWLPYVAGGAVGVLPVLLLVSMADTAGGSDHPGPSAWWPLLALLPATLVVGGAVRNALLAREAMRTGSPLAENVGMVWRMAVCCAVLLTIAAALSGLTAFPK